MPASWALYWNNPKLHPPQRRKTWLACPEHRESLSAFLSARGFLRELDPLEEPPPGTAPPAAATGGDPPPRSSPSQ